MANLPTRNNNPGDLRDPKTGKFRNFNTPAEGYAAMLNDLEGKFTGNNRHGLSEKSTLADLVKVWAPPSENDTAKYIADMSNTLGVAPTTTLGELHPRITDVAQAIAKKEGYNGTGISAGNGLGALTPAPYTPTYVAPEQPTANQQQQTQQPTDQNSLNQVYSDIQSNKVPTGADFWKYTAGKTLGFLGENIKKGINFAFPVGEDIYNAATGQGNKSVTQQLADLGMSALMFTGIGEAAKGGSLVSKIIKSAPVTGYGIGSLSAMQEGKGVKESLAPNVSNILGAATGVLGAKTIPTITKALSTNFSKGGALKAIDENITSEINRTSSGRNLVKNLSNGGKDAIRTMIMSGAIPEVEGNRFVVDGAISKLENNISQLGKARAAALDKTVSGQSLDELANSVKNYLTSGRSAYGGEAQATLNKIDNIVNDIHQSTGKNFFTTSELETMKEELARNSKVYKRNGSIGDSNAASMLSDVLRGKIEDIANKSGFSGMKEYNQYIANNYDAIKILEKLGNQTVKGGRLGNIMRGNAAAISLSSKANGFVPTIMSMMLGDATGNGIGKIIGNTSISNPLRDAILENMEKENPQIVQQLLDFTGQEGKVAQQVVTGKEGWVGNFVKGQDYASKMLQNQAARGGAGITQYIPR